MMKGWCIIMIKKKTIFAIIMTAVLMFCVGCASNETEADTPEEIPAESADMVQEEISETEITAEETVKNREIIVIDPSELDEYNSIIPKAEMLWDNMTSLLFTEDRDFDNPFDFLDDERLEEIEYSDIEELNRIIRADPSNVRYPELRIYQFTDLDSIVVKRFGDALVGTFVMRDNNLKT